MGSKAEDGKKSRRDVMLAVGSLVVSFISVGIAAHSVSLSRKNEERLAYDDTTNFNIIQNLWRNDPSYTLYNESTRKLDQPPSPGYMMAIPVKLFFDTEGAVNSNLALLPVSYDVVVEQVKSGETVGEVETSVLPAQFFAKEGSRDLIISEKVELDDGISAWVVTTPFLVIVAEINYSLVGDSESKSEVIVTTPLSRTTWGQEDLEHLKQYFRDNAAYEVKPPEEDAKKSIYQAAHDMLWSQVSKEGLDINPALLGGKTGGYGYILKDLNERITPEDPLFE